MPSTVKDILDIIELIAPTELAESWDNVGLMIGSPSAPANTVLLGLDPTLSLLKEAEALGADVIITHHQNRVSTSTHSITCDFFQQWQCNRSGCKRRL